MATRLVGKGFDSLEKLVEASNEELADINGLTENAIEDILKQAGHMLENLQVEEESLSELTEDASKLKTEVERLVLNILNRFDDSNALKEHVKELRKEISRALASLERVEAALSNQLRRLSKSLAKADEKISQVSGLGVEEVMSGLKKARKNNEKAVD